MEKLVSWQIIVEWASEKRMQHTSSLSLRRRMRILTYGKCELGGTAIDLIWNERRALLMNNTNRAQCSVAAPL